MGGVVLLDTFISFQDARRDPRFRALLHRIGLPQAAQDRNSEFAAVSEGHV
jgi:hypothetical protein